MELSPDFKVKGKARTAAEALKLADEIEAAVGAVLIGKAKPEELDVGLLTGAVQALRDHLKPVAEQPAPLAWAAVHFGGRRDGKIYNTCDTREQIDAYIQQVHQSSDSVTLTARPLAFADTAPGAAVAAREPENWLTPTTYLQRFGDAMALLCNGNRPSDEILSAWLDRDADDMRLQEFACSHGPAWAQGIGMIDAAQVMADPPTEGVAHECLAPREEADPIAALVAEHARLIDEGNNYAYFELAYTRQTDWMAWITDKPGEQYPDRKVLFHGQGLTPEEACSNALKESAAGT